MKYSLKTPCPQCPFRTDIKPFVRRGRMAEIVEQLQRGIEFACHKTVDYDAEDFDMRVSKPDEQHCAGALILLEHEDQTGVSQMSRIMMRLGMFNPDDLDMAAPVFASFAEASEAGID